MNENKGILAYVIFFGALWGILEATLGYALQFLPPLVSGSVMFPIAASLMILTYNHTKSRSSIIYVAMIAASIKSINFFMPGLLPIKTYNPMIAIMLQSLVMVVIIPLFQKKEVSQVLLGLFIIGFSWRLLFLGNIAINNALTGFQFMQLQSFANMINFVFLYGLIEAIFLVFIFYAIKLTVEKISFSFKPNLVISISSYLIAVLLTIFL
jgi:hypothetical protein